MTRTRAAIVGAIVVCVAVVAVVAVVASSSGNDDGPRAFVVRDASSALLIEWTRVGDDVSGSMTRAQLVVPEASRFASNKVAAGVPREVVRDSRPFTGTISGDSVRLLFSDGALGGRVNGKLDGDKLTLVVTGEGGPPTLRLTGSSRQDFDTVVGRMRAAETRRAGKARATLEGGDAADRVAIKRVATAYRKALDPGSPDDPCRYLTAAARASVVADPAPDAPSGCKAVVRFDAQAAEGSPLPKNLGAAKIYLRDPLSDTGTQLRFAAIPNDPINLLKENGQWRIAESR
jgi:hypothetical protein